MHAWKWKKTILFSKTTGMGCLNQQWNCTLGEHLNSSWLTDITLVTKNITTISCISSFIGSQYPFRDSGHYCTRWSRTTDFKQKAKYSLYNSWTILSDAFTFLTVTTRPTACHLQYMKMIGSVRFQTTSPKVYRRKCELLNTLLRVHYSVLISTKCVSLPTHLNWRRNPDFSGKAGIFHSSLLLLLHHYVCS